MPTSIYTLSDPDSGEVRYVGKTSQAPKVRHKSHWAQARWAKNLPQTHVARWIRTLAKNPVMVVLVVVENILGAETEMAVIALYRRLGYRLINTTIGGDGAAGYKLTPEQLVKRKGWPHGFKKGHQMTPEDRLAQRTLMKNNKFALGHIPDVEHKAKMVAGVRRSFAARRGGLIIGSNWEAIIPFVKLNDRVAFPKHERRGWHKRRLANGLRNLGMSWKSIVYHLQTTNGRTASVMAYQFRRRWKDSLPEIIFGDTWSAVVSESQLFFQHSS